MAGRLILASESKSRIELLKQAGYQPDQIYPADIDETPLAREKPLDLSKRLAQQKAEKIYPLFQDDVVLAADTVAAVGRYILPKASTESDSRLCLNKISGRRHRVYTSIAIMYRGKLITRSCQTIVKVKRLSAEEIELYVNSKQWYAKAGGYGLRGLAAIFIKSLQGCDTTVVGLPLHATYQLLNSIGFKPNIF